jgi:hypothetical protein
MFCMRQNCSDAKTTFGDKTKDASATTRDCTSHRMRTARKSWRICETAEGAENAEGKGGKNKPRRTRRARREQWIAVGGMKKYATAENWAFPGLFAERIP